VGIYLGLQYFQLRIFSLLAEKVFFFDQVLHGVNHVVIGAGEFSYFIFSLDDGGGQGNQFPLLYLLHAGSETDNTSGHGFGKDGG